MRDFFERFDWTGLTLRYVDRAASITGERVRRFAERDKYQLGMKIGGKTDIVYDGRKYKYYGGTLLYLPKADSDGIEYDRSVTEGGDGAYIFFDSMNKLPPHPILKKLGDADKVFSLFCKLANIWSVSGAGGFESMAAFYKLLAAVRDDVASSERKNVSSERLPAVEKYIAEHFCDNYIDVSVLAEIAGLSLDYFRHRFTELYGIPPLQYIMRLKLARAKELLSSGKSVSEAAMMTGFADPNYFTRFFKERTGVVPTEFVRRRLC